MSTKRGKMAAKDGAAIAGSSGPRRNTRRRLTGTLCGVAGEYLVAAELSRRGYVATLSLKNTRGIDILAANADATRSVGI